MHRVEADRRIFFEGISNARDIGGIITKTGESVRAGCVIRSANLSAATENDIRVLRDRYHLQLILDLRTPMAARMKPDAPVPGALYDPMPVFDDAMVGVTHERDRDYARRKTKMPDMKQLYALMVTRENCRERFGQVISKIMCSDFDQGSVLCHCSEGKDRCGLTVAFLLSALGVSREKIMEDYLITNEVSVPKAEKLYLEVLKNGAEEEVARSVRDSFVVKEEYLNEAFRVIDASYTSMEDYLEDGLMIPEKTIRDFREKMGIMS